METDELFVVVFAVTDVVVGLCFVAVADVVGCWLWVFESLFVDVVFVDRWCLFGLLCLSPSSESHTSLPVGFLKAFEAVLRST